MKAILLSAAVLAATLALPGAAVAQRANGHANVGNDAVAPCGTLNKNSSDGNAISADCSVRANGGAGGDATGGSVGDVTVLGGSNGGVSVKSRRQAPPAVAPGTYSNHSCLGGFGIGASAPFGGLSLGGTTLDESCNTREDAMMLFSAGLDQAALARMCLGGPKMREAVAFGGFDCLAVDKAPVAAYASPTRASDCLFAQDDHRAWATMQRICQR